MSAPSRGVLARVLVLVLAGLVPVACAHDPGPGQVAPGEPVQSEVSEAPAIRRGKYDIVPLATFTIEARVLSVEKYRFDRPAELCVLDLALGWGPMSDRDVLSRFDIDQGYRTFSWTTREFPIPREDAESHAANVHVIASTRAVGRDLARLREGDVVKLEGSLVEARGDDGWTWRSSLSRQDVGMGACELFWVESVRIR